ncbi:DUF4349 domain-containing protein [Microbispora sp. H10949]|uniref:DUF4349 domain-containing protein n=1 Tax=Microbispora sp. H10949 TaxID=2729111 RepID=UPI0016031E7A|nr:DUF4349 domain-containing protein [Microbispora sp. H10949]
MSRIRYGAAALAAVAFLLTGCGGGDDSSSGQAASDAAAPVPAMQEQAPGEGSAGGSAGGSAQDSKAASGGGSGKQDDVKLGQADRAIVYTSELIVEAKDVTAAADRAKEVVSGAGGYVAQERSDFYAGDEHSPGGGQWVIVFKVPPDRYSGVLAQLGRDLGVRKSMRQNTEDVTEEVADVASRVKSAEAALGQFRTLLSKAEKIGEIMEIEREISSREAELESLQARQKALEGQTGMGTLTLTLFPQPGASPSPQPKKTEDAPGFLAGLRAGWDALSSATGVTLTVVGVLLPWLAVGAVLWLAGREIVRRVRRRRPAAPPAPPASPGPAAPRPPARTPAYTPGPGQAPGDEPE